MTWLEKTNEITKLKTHETVGYDVILTVLYPNTNLV